MFQDLGSSTGFRNQIPFATSKEKTALGAMPDVRHYGIVSNETQFELHLFLSKV